MKHEVSVRTRALPFGFCGLLSREFGDHAVQLMLMILLTLGRLSSRCRSGALVLGAMSMYFRGLVVMSRPRRPETLVLNGMFFSISGMIGNSYIDPLSAAHLAVCV